MRIRLLTTVLVTLSLVGPEKPCQGASLELLVPAYANPCCGGGPEMWTSLVNAGLLLAGDIHIIFNPASGPGVGPVDPNYVNSLGEGSLVEFHATGGTILGYVATSYAARSLAEVQTEIDLYYDPAYWRGAGVLVDGIFFDEMSNDLADTGYYQTLRDHMRGHDAAARVVGNPGVSSTVNPSGQTTWTVVDYADSADTIVTFEGDANRYRDDYIAPSWAATLGPDHFAHIIHTEPVTSVMITDLSLAVARKAAFVYVTDDVMANPYDLIPSYWVRELDAAFGIVFADGFESGDLSAWQPPNSTMASIEAPVQCNLKR